MMYPTALTLHIIGIVLLSGSIFMDFFFTRQFWKVNATGKENQATIGIMIGKIQRFMAIGGLLTILAGIWMISLVHTWTSQFWFHLKMGLLILLLFNAIFFRRRLGNSLMVVVEGNAGDEKKRKLKSNLTTLQIIQMLLLVLMYILSVFKFN